MQTALRRFQSEQSSIWRQVHASADVGRLPIVPINEKARL